jgi:4-hydroxybenzoate polyprenyltransferase
MRKIHPRNRWQKFKQGTWFPYLQLMRFDRPVGTLLLLWPTLWAVWIAGEGHPPVGVTLVFVLGVVVMRAAGCVINDWADRHFDGHVARTKDRPLAAGKVPEKHALYLFAGLMFIAFGLVLSLGWPTVRLSLVAAALATIYPFMKRYTYYPQVVLGAAFGWGIPMAFMAIRGEIPPVAWVLYITNLLWTVAYDTQYAMVDRKDDLRIGIKSTAILFGDADRLIIGMLQVMVVLGLLLTGAKASLGTEFYWSLFAVIGLFIYQQWLTLKRKPQLCFRAFLNNQWVGAVVFLGLVAAYS